MNKAQAVLNLCKINERKPVQAKIRFFDKNSMEGAVILPNGKTFEIKLPKYGSGEHVYKELMKDKEEGDELTVDLDPVLMEYGMVRVLA